MKNKINIAVFGLGQIGIYLLNELNKKKGDIEIKKENLKLIKKFFTKIR